MRGIINEGIVFIIIGCYYSSLVIPNYPSLFSPVEYTYPSLERNNACPYPALIYVITTLRLVDLTWGYASPTVFNPSYPNSFANKKLIVSILEKKPVNITLIR